MALDYLGIHVGTFEYIAILLFGLIIFVIIMIATERGRQRRHRMEMHKRRMMHHQHIEQYSH
jgi:UDP-N-acetylmuramyl pentapeptide phosphotransferase/UDP-N-acetylglucosamine-1-phosphate transferase